MFLVSQSFLEWLSQLTIIAPRGRSRQLKGICHQISLVCDLSDDLLTLNLAKLAPSRIRDVGTVMPPRKVVVSNMKASGGSPLGAFGIRVPVQLSTGVKSDLSGSTREQGRAIMIAIVTGMTKLFAMRHILKIGEGLCIEGAGVAG